MRLRPGEVWLADLGLAAKARPIVILSRDDPEAPRALAIYVPLTTQNRGSKYEVELPRLHFLREASVANVQGIGSLTIDRLERRLGELPAENLRHIYEALAFAIRHGLSNIQTLWRWPLRTVSGRLKVWIGRISKPNFQPVPG